MEKLEQSHCMWPADQKNYARQKDKSLEYCEIKIFELNIKTTIFKNLEAFTRKEKFDPFKNNYWTTHKHWKGCVATKIINSRIDKINK